MLTLPHSRSPQILFVDDLPNPSESELQMSKVTNHLVSPMIVRHPMNATQSINHQPSTINISQKHKKSN